MIRKVIMATTIIVCLRCAGCEPFSESKKLAKERWDKASAEIKLTLAQQEYENHNFDEAKKIVSKCVITEPNNIQAHLLYGKVLLVEGDQANAVRELRLAVEFDEELAEGWYWLGLATQGPDQTRQGWWESQQTLFYYKKALSLNPENADYILAVAEMYSEQGKPEEAISLLEEKIASMPRKAELKTGAADLMWCLGKNERAIELYKQTMLLKGDDSGIAEALGYYYVFSGRWSEAVEIFDRLIEQCQDEEKKKVYLHAAAFSNLNCSRYNQAVNCYNKLSVEGRNNSELWVKMGQAALGAGSAERAFSCGEQALNLEPGNADAIALIGCAKYSMRDYAKAIKYFEKITNNTQLTNFAWLMRARCYEQLGHKVEAECAFQKALEIKPRSELGDFLAKGKNAENLGLPTGD